MLATLHFSIILFTPNIQWNLLSIVALLELGFKFIFDNNNVGLFFGIIFYGSGFIIDKLIIFLDILFKLW